MPTVKQTVLDTIATQSKGTSKLNQKKHIARRDQRNFFFWGRGREKGIFPMASVHSFPVERTHCLRLGGHSAISVGWWSRGQHSGLQLSSLHGGIVLRHLPTVHGACAVLQFADLEGTGRPWPCGAADELGDTGWRVATWKTTHNLWWHDCFDEAITTDLAATMTGRTAVAFTQRVLLLMTRPKTKTKNQPLPPKKTKKKNTNQPPPPPPTVMVT